MEERRYPTLRLRITALIDGCDAAIALPGGPGTQAEIVEMWNHLLIGGISPRPLILIGEGWRATVEQFYRAFDVYIPKEQRQWVTFAENVNHTIELLKQ